VQFHLHYIMSILLESGMPMPERIPRPLIEDRDKFKALGIRLNIEECENLCKLVRYKLPEGWMVLDESVKPTQPNFFFINEKYQKMVHFHGVWMEDISWGQLEIDFL